MVETALRTPAANISKAAGEMERKSPLFFGTGAGGQDTLFSHYASAAEREAAARTPHENARRTKVTVGTNPYGKHLELNHDGAQVLGDVLKAPGGSWLGVMMEKGDADRAIASLRVKATEAAKANDFAAAAGYRNSFKRLTEQEIGLDLSLRSRPIPAPQPAPKSSRISGK